MEMYGAWKAEMKRIIHTAKRGGIKLFNISMDMWEEKINGRKYLGKPSPETSRPHIAPAAHCISPPYMTAAYSCYHLYSLP